ncbi:MAG TPA: hypothetical protein ENN58_04460 [bacterium]|nr:hypothetical protein [bacterium]
MIKKAIYIFIVLFLLANFSWGGKPLWRYIIPGSGDVSETAKEGVEKSRMFIEKAGESVKEGAGKVKESFKKGPTAEIPEEDREKLEEFIRESTEKKKKEKKEQ